MAPNLPMAAVLVLSLLAQGGFVSKGGFRIRQRGIEVCGGRARRISGLRVHGKRKKANPNVLGRLRRKVELLNEEAVDAFKKEQDEKAINSYIIPDPDRVANDRAGENKEIYALFKTAIDTPEYEGPGSKPMMYGQLMKDVDQATLWQDYVAEAEEDLEHEDNEELGYALQVLEEEGKDAFLDTLEIIYGDKAELVLEDLRAMARAESGENPFPGAPPALSGYPGQQYMPSSAPKDAMQPPPWRRGYPRLDSALSQESPPQSAEKKKQELAPKPVSASVRRIEALRKAGKISQPAKAAANLPLPDLERPELAGAMSAAASSLPVSPVLPPPTGASASLPGGLGSPSSPEDFEFDAESVKKMSQAEISDARRAKKKLRKAKKLAEKKAQEIVQIDIPDKKTKQQQRARSSTGSAGPSASNGDSSGGAASLPAPPAASNELPMPSLSTKPRSKNN